MTLVPGQLDEEETTTGKEGEYIPLSVYATKGYDKAFLKYIEDTCLPRMEGTIPTYNYKIT